MNAPPRDLFTRFEGNPILSAANWPYPIDRVCNPAATEFNEETVLLVRTVDRREFSHLSLARQVISGGLIRWQIDENPTLEADPEHGEFNKGLEDPRVVWVEELREYVIACVSFRMERIGTPYGISLIGTRDFKNFRRISKPLDPENKNASLLPKMIGGKFALIHRPIRNHNAHVAISFSEDLVNWGGEEILFSARPWYWDSVMIGLGCPPIETKEGWLVVYHGSWGKANKLVYRVGLALLDLESLKLIRRSEYWVLGPETQYEGGEDGIVFPCGAIVDGNDLRIYYGTNDSKIGLATAHMDEVMDYITKCPSE